MPSDGQKQALTAGCVEFVDSYGFVNVSSATGRTAGRVPASLREQDDPQLCMVNSWEAATGMYVASGTMHNVTIIAKVVGYANEQNFVRAWKKSPILQEAVTLYEVDGKRVWSTYVNSVEHYAARNLEWAESSKLEHLRANHYIFTKIT